MGATTEQLKYAEIEERRVLNLMLNHGLIKDYKHYHGTSKDWSTHIDAEILLKDSWLTVDLKKAHDYGFILEHENRYLNATGHSKGLQEYYLLYDLNKSKVALMKRVEVLELALSKSGEVPDRFKITRVNNSVRSQPFYAYTGNLTTNTKYGGKKKCYDVVQRLPYRDLKELESWQEWVLK